MKQEFVPNPFQYLMIFLRETPEDGIDGFQKQIISDAAYSTEGSNNHHLFYDCIGDETKIKVLVTGEIELNEKNVFIGLKMAFPEWDFQRYPLHIQKLFIQKSEWSEVKEAGVIATTDRTRTYGSNKWGLPCVLNLSPDQDAQYTKPKKSEAIPSLYEQVSSWKSDEQETYDVPDPFAQLENRQTYTHDTYEEIDFTQILDFADEISNEEFSQETPQNPSDQNNFQQESPFRKFLHSEEVISGADSKEILTSFGEEKKTKPFTGFEENEDFDFSYLDEAPSFTPTVEEMDHEENYSPLSRFNARPFIDNEEEYISPEFLEPEIEFEMEGLVEDIVRDEGESLLEASHDEDKDPSSFGPYLEIANKLQSAVLRKIAQLPLRKIALTSLIAGLAMIALSIGVKTIEPDYETTRKSAGVIDLYDWIILNDLVGPDTDTDALMDLWKESSEYRQFWLWFDTRWTPRISRYEEIEAGLRVIGGILLSPAIIIMLITVLGRSARARKQIQNQTMDVDPTNRISLSFSTYTNDWSIVDTWAKETGFKILEVEGDRRLFRRKGNLAHPPILCLLGISEGLVQLEVWVSTRVPPVLIPLLSDLGLEVLEAKGRVLPGNIKSLVNKLLLRLGHPPLA